HAVYPVAAMDDRNAQVGEAPVIAKRSFDLRRQFASRFEDETPEIAMLGEERQDGQRERRCLARAGLGGADQVLPGKNDRKRAELDRGRLAETHCLGSAHHFIRETKIFERHEAESTRC
ncbi:MAG: hypothetical protein QOD80_1055, partial [Verrucomicrobiota bacterium]